jgi:hypothetical protein
MEPRARQLEDFVDGKALTKCSLTLRKLVDRCLYRDVVSALELARTTYDSNETAESS